MSRPSSVSVKSDLDTEWYSNKKIDDVFAHELRDQKDVVALPAIPTEGSDYFKRALYEAKNLAKGGKKVLMPLNIHGDHWVGGMMKMDGGELKFFYNDSLGNPIDGIMRKEIERAGIKITDLKAKQQDDHYNCGPLTIHNLLEMSKATTLEEEALKQKLLTSAKELDLQKLRERYSNLSTYESDKNKEKEICGEMCDIFGKLKDEGRVHEENGVKRFDCESTEEARKLAEKIKKSYEDLGVGPCDLQQKGEQWIVRIPEACSGKDVFSMNPEQLQNLREEIQTTKSVAKGGSEEKRAPVCGKFTEMVQKREGEAKSATTER